MKIRIIGAGMYGSHLAVALIADGHDVVIQESADRIFAGASGNNPARLHIGPHYPRSKSTRSSCQAHHAEFMATYGKFTRAIPTNIYAIAAEGSLVDFGTYRETLRSDGLECITVERPLQDFDLHNVEGAILCAERHIVIDEVRQHFVGLLADHIEFGVRPERVDDPRWDLTIDATFCSLDGTNVHRYEPCLTVLMGRRHLLDADRAVTIMDGPFPSLYPWDGGIASLTSAMLTPLARVSDRAAAERVLNTVTGDELTDRAEQMVRQMRGFWPGIDDYEIADFALSIRAQPASAADARFVDVVRVGERALRVRAGKIANVFDAERLVKRAISEGLRNAA